MKNISSDADLQIKHGDEHNMEQYIKPERRRSVLVYRSKAFRSILKLVLLIALLVTGWGLYVASTPIDTYCYDVKMKGLAAGVDGLRIVQMSDIHLGPFVPESLVHRAVDQANNCKPDIAVITGDFVSLSGKYADRSMQILSGIHARHGIYMVAGNHDHQNGIEYTKAAARKYGLSLLINDWAEPVPGFRIVGIDDETAGNIDVEKATKGLSKNHASLILTHEPTTSRLVNDYNALILAGHTHGGQIVLPYITDKYIWRSFPYVHGWFRVNKAKMYVNRGIGFNGVLPLRFNCNSEVSVCTLKSSK